MLTSISMLQSFGKRSRTESIEKAGCSDCSLSLANAFRCRLAITPDSYRSCYHLLYSLCLLLRSLMVVVRSQQEVLFFVRRGPEWDATGVQSVALESRQILLCLLLSVAASVSVCKSVGIDPRLLIRRVCSLCAAKRASREPQTLSQSASAALGLCLTRFLAVGLRL